MASPNTGVVEGLEVGAGVSDGAGDGAGDGPGVGCALRVGLAVGKGVGFCSRQEPLEVASVASVTLTSRISGASTKPIV